MAGIEINTDGTSVFENKTIRGSDMDLVATWHGASAPTVNNQIPTGGLFLNETLNLIQKNIGTIANPIWQLQYPNMIYGTSQVSGSLNGTLEQGSHDFKDLEITAPTYPTDGNSLIIRASGTLTLNSELNANGKGRSYNAVNLGCSGGGSTISASPDGGGAPANYVAPTILDVPSYRGASARIQTFADTYYSYGGAAIIVFANKIIFGANGSITASGQAGYNTAGNAYLGSGGGGMIVLVTGTPLTADDRAKIIYSDNLADRNGKDYDTVNPNVAGGKARLAELIV